jgi:TnpA family transposase
MSGEEARAEPATVAILGQWTELMRLKASIETGAVVPSIILRKLAAAGAGNVLSRALRALGRIERTLFTLQWLSDPALSNAAMPVAVIAGTEAATFEGRIRYASGRA